MEHHKGIHGTLPTVIVKADNEEGKMAINESDFDPKVHELFDAPAGKKDDKRDWAKATKAEIMEALDEVDVEYDPKATKDELLEIANKNLE